jgi:hypothetical protein
MSGLSSLAAISDHVVAILPVIRSSHQILNKPRWRSTKAVSRR